MARSRLIYAAAASSQASPDDYILLSTHWIGTPTRMRHLAQVVLLSVSSLCAGCYLPLTQRYYVPTAQGATVANTNCARYPPYAALFNLGDMERHGHVYVYLDKSVLTIIVSAGSGDTIALDPTLIRLEADGQPVIPNSIRYTMGKSGAAKAGDAAGRIDVNTDYLIVSMSLNIDSPLNVSAHLPSISINGTAYSLSDTSFTYKKQTHRVLLVLNC
jgi:hypothetical protein